MLSVTYIASRLASRLLYQEPKDMRNSFKLGSGKRTLAILLLLVGAISPVKLHAEDKRNAMAKLQIQIMVMPIVVAEQQARRPEMQPSQSPISFNFSPSNQQSGNYSMHELTVPDQNGTGTTAVVKTLTVVPE